ncbi:RNA polymerase sigma factor (sigma-70 family) [Mucilaginibacter sp. HD30]
MPADQREVLIMSKYQELPYSEIAAILKTTEGNIKVKVYRAIQELKKMYNKQ